jgi:type IV pilus assembly protein PilA
MKEMVLRRMALKAKDKKGFTLVEVIVVLVILAILMAIAIPSLTGYINKANDQALKAEGRSMYAAAQVLASDLHNIDLSTTKPSKVNLLNASSAPIPATPPTGDAVNADWIAAIEKLTSTKFGGTISMKVESGNTIKTFAYTKAGSLSSSTNVKWTYFDGTEWTVVEKDATPVTGANLP